MTITKPVLLSDEHIIQIPVHDNGEALVDLRDLGISCPSPGPSAHHSLVRKGLGERLVLASRFLPRGIKLHVVEGFRPNQLQRRLYNDYRLELLSSDPTLTSSQSHLLASRFVAPIEVAPHVAGAAVDLTLIDHNDKPLDMGTPIDATPDASNGACYFEATNISSDARENRDLLADVLTSVGLVNYSTEWWHWSYGDRYWAYMHDREHAIYGPIENEQTGKGSDMNTPPPSN